MLLKLIDAFVTYVIANECMLNSSASRFLFPPNEIIEPQNTNEQRKQRMGNVFANGQRVMIVMNVILKSSKWE